jgi:hypothetical protein
MGVSRRVFDRQWVFSSEVSTGIEVFGEFSIGVGVLVEFKLVYVRFSAFFC